MTIIFLLSVVYVLIYFVLNKYLKIDYDVKNITMSFARIIQPYFNSSNEEEKQLFININYLINKALFDIKITGQIKADLIKSFIRLYRVVQAYNKKQKGFTIKEIDDVIKEIEHLLTTSN